MAKEPPNKRLTGDKKRRFPRPFGRYILEKSLSRGGMGEVYLAIVKQLQKRCVIKTIRGDLTGEEEFVGRFADEAKILVRAAHTNIIRYFDAGKVAADYYIAMEHMHGRDLGDVLDRAYERGEPMPPDIGLYITQNLLEGLDYAHQMKDELGRPMGLVHRDISPQNVMIGFDGSIKLIDFGLARTDVLPNRTQGALAVGKYGYMSPEQARHEPLDGRADIYSTGVMLFEVFTGDRLVDERDQATLWQRVLHPKHRTPRSVLPTLSEEIDHLIMQAVAVRPRERFPSARVMADYVSELRGPRSNKKSLLEYLRYLYPKVDFLPPPIPPLDDLADGVRKSVIFATSREGARSVFGRGELPIEGTMHINAADVRREIEKNEELAADNRNPFRNQAIYRPHTKTERRPMLAQDLEALDKSKHLKGQSANETEILRYQVHRKNNKKLNQRLHHPGDHVPTEKGAGHEDADAFVSKHAPNSAPRNSSSDTNTINEYAPTETNKALLGSAGPAKHSEDDQTIMMHGPPTALYTEASRRTPLVFSDKHHPILPPSAQMTEDLGPTEVSAPQPNIVTSNPPPEGLAGDSASTNINTSPPNLLLSKSGGLTIPPMPPLPTHRNTPSKQGSRSGGLAPALAPLKRETTEELSAIMIVGLVALVVSIMVVVFMLISE